MRLSLILPTLLVALLVVAASAQSNDPPPLDQLFPAETALFVEGDRANRIVDAILASGIRERITATPEWKAFLASKDGREMQAGIGFLTGLTGRPPLELISHLTGGEIGFGLVAMGPGKPQPLLIARPRDPATVKSLLNALIAVSGQSPRTVTKHGVEATVLGDAAFFWQDDTFVVGTNQELLVSVVDRMRGKGGATKPLADDAEYAAATSQLSRLGPLRAFINVQRIRNVQGGNLKGLEGPLSNPLGSLVFGGYRQLLRDARSVAAGIGFDENVLRVAGFATPVATDSGHPCYFPASPARTVPHPADTIASVSVRRDVSSWWEARLDLVSASAHVAMAKFATDIGNVLGGRDFGEEILSLAGPGMELFVLAPASPPAGGQSPEPLIPGFALAVPLQESGDVVVPRLQVMFQTIVTFLNIDRAQKDQPPFLMGSRVHRGVTIIGAAPPVSTTDERPGIEANFAPALAVQNGVLFIGSHHHAIEQLVNAGADGHSRVLSPNAGLRINAAGLGDILGANRSALVTNGVLEGKTMKQATSEISILLTLISLFSDLQVELTPTAEGRLDLEIELKLQGETTPRVERL